MNTHLGSRVARLNPSWNQAYTDETLMAGFLKAVELTGGAQEVGGGGDLSYGSISCCRHKEGLL